MTDKELRKLSKTDLLKLLIELSRENRQLNEQLHRAEAQLESRRLKIEDCGSIADAALRLSGVFEDAQRAADLYRENVEHQCEEMIAEAERRAADILAAAEQGRKEAGE